MNSKSKFAANIVARGIPVDLANRIQMFSDNPLAWWYGQMLNFTIRYSKKVQNHLKSILKDLEFQHLIAGIHIRRTDKIDKNIKPHSLDEYMGHVDDYFSIQELIGSTQNRSILLVTDDPTIIYEIQKKYPNYRIISNLNAAKIASDLNSRWTKEGLLGIITDIYLLSLCDFIVCTYSSNICRLMSEYKQLKFPETTQKVVSLDRVYFTNDLNERTGVAIQNHIPRAANEMAAQKSDKLTIHLDQNLKGFYYATNLKTLQTGYLPAYKVDLIVETIDSSKLDQL